jgi:hypothetical protein
MIDCRGIVVRIRNMGLFPLQEYPIVFLKFKMFPS